MEARGVCAESSACFEIADDDDEHASAPQSRPYQCDRAILFASRRRQFRPHAAGHTLLTPAFAQKLSRHRRLPFKAADSTMFCVWRLSFRHFRGDVSPET